jgi:hypothetical protein
MVAQLQQTREIPTTCAACGGAIVQPVRMGRDFFCSKKCRNSGRSSCRYCHTPLRHPRRSDFCCDAYCHTHHFRDGEDAPHAKLTWGQVDEIRALYADGNVGKGTLAKKYGVNKCAIKDIIAYRHWNPENDPRVKEEGKP